MFPTLTDLAQAVDGSALQRIVVSLLRDVPGFPPIIQTVHILGISAIMGSVVLVNLRVLGVALPSQPAAELTKRLMPWTWWALPVVALSGAVFVFARPLRYAANPVFALKFTFLAPAVLLALVFHLGSVRDVTFWDRSTARRVAAKLIVAGSLLLWVGVVLAGRWIAYADYLFPE